MQIRYFNTAWQDIRSTPGWVGKLLLLSLLMFIPVFGWIVVAGYLLGWARDIAWGVHGPMPARIFGNEDGKLYSRGFFAWIIGIVFTLAPAAIMGAVNAILGIGAAGFAPWHHGGMTFAISAGIMSGVVAMAVTVAGVALYVLATMFQWIGWMRMAVYGRLSAGFQFERIWTMLRRDTHGLARIFGMSLIVMAIVGVLAVVAMVGIGIGVMIMGVYAAGTGINSGTPSFAVGVLVLMAAFLALVSYAGMATSVFCIAMVMRAMGHWTRQFDVPHWRGQDDPMPFENVATS